MQQIKRVEERVHWPVVFLIQALSDESNVALQFFAFCLDAEVVKTIFDALLFLVPVSLDDFAH